MKKIIEKAWDWIKRALRYIRINDEKDMLSLTNIAMVVVLVKVWQTDVTTFKDITALAVAVMGYQGKRLIEKHRPKRRRLSRRSRRDRDI